ncbi:hypothetical protein CRENBAI_024266 [Crenichthys baileyi]|uniref:Uncharacterized protein n=1 Tax=Crenichthys baileyi TaxID=28760 RepID=A0AAV9QRY6_9TELE
MDFRDNHGVLPVESRKTPRRRCPRVHVILGREQFGEPQNSKICCPVWDRGIGLGTPTTGDRVKPAKPDTGDTQARGKNGTSHGDPIQAPVFGSCSLLLPLLTRGVH